MWDKLFIVLLIIGSGLRLNYLIGLSKKGYGSPIFRRTLFSEPYGKVNKKQAKGYERVLLKFEILFQFFVIGVVIYLLLEGVY